MKVLHVVAGSLNGGASKGAIALHKQLMKEGVDSTLLCNRFSETSIKNVSFFKITNILKVKKTFNYFLDKFFLLFYSGHRGFYSSGLFGFDITKTKQYKDADIVHLHWINDGFISLNCIDKIKKPIVWTLRDMWAFTGGCHYSINCDGYKSGCKDCPMLGYRSVFKIPSIQYNYKVTLSKKISYVGISDWITDEALKSNPALDIRTIQNTVSIDMFTYFGKDFCRSELGICTSKKIILVGAYSLGDEYKGIDFLIKSLNLLNSDEFILISFGSNCSVFERISLETINFGYIEDITFLNKLYCAADVFVVPSIMEAFGKTVVESIVSGTPVVSFENTGPESIIIHKKNGYLAKYKDIEDFAFGIKWVVNNRHAIDSFKTCESYARSKYDLGTIAKKYIELYQGVFDGYKKSKV